MSLRLLESFDWSTTASQYNMKYQSTVVPGSIVAGRTGNCIRDNNWQIILTRKDTWIVGFAAKLRLAGGNVNMCWLCDANSPQIRVDFNGITGVVSIFRGGTFLGVGAVFLGSTVTPLPMMINQWYHVQVKVVIANGVAGSVEVRINGLTALNLLGIDTQATANAWADQYYFGTGWLDTDDLWLCDGDGAAPYNDFLGDLAIHNLRPNGVGDLSAWAPSAGANWQCVDEIPPDLDVTYVASAVVGNIDTYNFEDIGLPGTVRGVQVNVLARKDDAGVRTLRPVYRQGGANFVGVNDTLNITYKTTRMVMQVDPATGADWLPADVDSAQFGEELTA